MDKTSQNALVQIPTELPEDCYTDKWLYSKNGPLNKNQIQHIKAKQDCII